MTDTYGQVKAVHRVGTLAERVKHFCCVHTIWIGARGYVNWNSVSVRVMYAEYTLRSRALPLAPLSHAMCNRSPASPSTPRSSYYTCSCRRSLLALCVWVLLVWAGAVLLPVPSWGRVLL